MSREALAQLLDCSLIICAGSGGVGKTTIAAAMGLQAARRGRKVLVLTIDPARRLADSLGVGPIGNEPVRIDPAKLASLGVPDGGALWAVMLDTRRTFDGLVRRYASSAEAAERILANRYYQQISQSMVGSQEYMAMEYLLEAYEQGVYDLVVLDTPPSRHALDFLNAPSKLRAVLEEGVLNWLLKPSSFFLKRMQRKAGVDEKTGFLDTIERLLGLGMLRDLSEFVLLFKDMLDDFRKRAAKGQALLKSDGTRFVLVTAPRRVSAQEASFFLKRIQARGFHFGGVVVNRVLPLAAGDTSKEELAALRAAPESAWRALFPLPPPGDLDEATYRLLQDRVQAALETLPAIAEVDRENMRWLRKKVGRHHLFVRLPELPFDVHDLDGLNLLADRFRKHAQVAPSDRGAA